MRLQFPLSAILIVATFVSCGSGENAAGGAGGQPGQDPGLSDPATAVDCEAAWNQYVVTHPMGMKTRYENRFMGSVSFSQNEVTTSTENLVTEKTLTQNQTAIKTTKKPDFIASCRGGSNPGTVNDPIDGTIEERRKEFKIVRAGRFATNYARIRTKISSNNGNMSTALAEIWTTDDAFQMIVFQKTATPANGASYDSSTELITFFRP